MEQVRLEFILQAQSPIAHHSETFGNTQVLMRERVRQPDGTWASVPIITGDTMRHGLRECASYALLDCAGLLGENLSEAALVLLFSGGVIAGSGGSSVRLDSYREMVDLVPPLALLGGCAENRSIPGRMIVDPARLICSETEHLTPRWAIEWAERDGLIASCRAHVEEEQRVRMDPRLDPGKRALLTSGAQRDIQDRLLASEAASLKGDAVAAEEMKSSMMPRRYEVVSAGSLFYWQVTATCYSDLDRDSLMVMVATFLRDARVGGKKATGHGSIKAVAARNVDLAPFSERSGTLELSTAVIGGTFRAHVAERSEKLRTWLKQVVA